MEKEKLNMKYPPNGLYCPICNSKATNGSYAINETANKVEMYKTCPKCKAQWTVIYNIIPYKITELEVIKSYNDIPLM